MEKEIQNSHPFNFSGHDVLQAGVAAYGRSCNHSSGKPLKNCYGHIHITSIAQTPLRYSFLSELFSF